MTHIVGGKSKSYGPSKVLHHNVSTRCIDCRKYTTHKPWDNDERKKRCAKCYDIFCNLEAEAIHARRNSTGPENINFIYEEETQEETSIMFPLQALENEGSKQMESKGASKS